MLILYNFIVWGRLLKFTIIFLKIMSDQWQDLSFIIISCVFISCVREEYLKVYKAHLSSMIGVLWTMKNKPAIEISLWKCNSAQVTDLVKIYLEVTKSFVLYLELLLFSTTTPQLCCGTALNDVS